MIEGCFAVTAEVLQLLTETFDVPLERLQLEDDDCDDGDDGSSQDHAESDGAGGDAKSGSLGASSSGSSRIRRSDSSGAATKTSDGTKTNKENIGPKKSAKSQDYRYAPLIMSNVDLFNRMQGSLFSF